MTNENPNQAVLATPALNKCYCSWKGNVQVVFYKVYVNTVDQRYALSRLREVRILDVARRYLNYLRLYKELFNR